MTAIRLTTELPGPRSPALLARPAAAVAHARTRLPTTKTSKVHPSTARLGPFAHETYRAPYAYCYRCSHHLACPSCSVACADAGEEYFKRYVEAKQVAAVLVEPVLGEGG